jgi:protein-tyrosine phosphatase
VENAEIPFYGEVNGFRVMLLEFPHGQIIPGSDKLVRWLLARKIRPLIAHPERNKQVMKDPSQLQPFIDSGCWLQVTAGSVLGGFGERAQTIARHLLEANHVTVLASDGHNTRARRPVLSHTYEYIAQHYGGPRARMLMLENPCRIAAVQFSSVAATA